MQLQALQLAVLLAEKPAKSLVALWVVVWAGAVATKGKGQAGAVIGGAAGGAGGAYVGRKVSGDSTGAIVGAGLGGAGGALSGKVIDESNSEQYDGRDHRYSDRKHKRKRGKGHYKNKHRGHEHGHDD